MRVLTAVLATLIAVAFGQTSDQTINRVFHFTNTSAPQSRQEILNMVRMIAQTQNATVDNSAGVLAVSGTSSHSARWFAKPV
jgi:hypothetical protein